MSTGITIALCTRNRIEELQRCVRSISASPPPFSPWEVIIVDDGQLSQGVIESTRTAITEAGGDLRYVKNDHPGGLIRARARAIQMASFDLITFLDDDVEVLPGYFDRLCETFRTHPDAVGVSGVDELTKEPPWGVRVWQYLFLHRARHPGRLTWSGFNRSMDKWAKQAEIFVSEFLSGCNMSFRRDALVQLEVPSFLTGYSLGEDLYLSWFAGKRGNLIVNPHMKVRHWHSRTGRLEVRTLWHMTVLNHWRLLCLMHRLPLGLSMAAFVWSTLGFVAQFGLAAVISGVKGDSDGVERNLQALIGVVSGSIEIWREHGQGPYQPVTFV